jgi:hypothetical protein
MTSISTKKTGIHVRRPNANAVLWTAQILLGALFIFAGGFKLVMSASDLGEGTALPVGFMRFIGVCELLGGIGLIVPGVVRFARVLTPLAAAGLAIIMVGAVTVSVIEVGVGAAVLPLVVGVGLAVVIRGRRSWIGA